MGFLSPVQIKEMGFAKVGINTRLSDKASYYNCSKIIIGNNVRIDDFCVLSAGVGGIEIEDHVHISVYSLLIGAGKIIMRDFSGLSSRVSVYSSSDDYTGIFMTNPTVPDLFRNVKNSDVCIGRHVIVGSGSILLPGVNLEEGVAIGALSMVTKNCLEFGIYSGAPAKRIKERKKDLLELEKKFMAEKCLDNVHTTHAPPPDLT